MKHVLVLSVFTLMFLSCKNEAKTNSGEEAETVETETNVKEETKPQDEVASSEFMPFTVNDALAAKVAAFLKNEHLKSDYEFLSDNDKKFQMAEVDLNDDGKNEIIINFFSSYFCGTGGCSLLLLDNELKVITKFSVTRTPFFITKEKVNDWRTIMVESQGKYVKLVFNGTAYPSNPTVVATTDEAPSGHDLILFDDNYSNSKTYTF